MTAPQPQDLQARAERLWPNQTSLQERWLHAIARVRATSRGWLLDKPIARQEQRRA